MLNSLRENKGAQARFRARDIERIFQGVAATALLASVVACGGGGGGDDSSPAPAPFVPPPPLPAVVSVPTPPGYDADKLAAFNRLNALRLRAGLGMVASDPKMDQAAQAHVNWMIENNTYSHGEVEGTLGFTGEDFGARDLAAGYAGTGSFGEIMSGGFSPDEAINLLVNAVYHREIALSIFPVDVGIGYSSSTAATAIPKPFVVDFSTPAFDTVRGGGQLTQASTEGVVIWPVDEATNVPINMGNEEPNPVPAQNVQSLGTPVSVSIRQGEAISVSNFSLLNLANNEKVDVALLTQATDPNFQLRSEFAAIVPLQYLKRATLYRVDFNGSATNSTGTKAVVRSWVFTTAQ